MEGRADPQVRGAVAPGWYRDPEHPARLRKWDGARWTDSWMKAPGSEVGPGPASAPAVLRAATVVPGWYDDPLAGGRTRQRWWDGSGWTDRLRHGRSHPGRPALSKRFFGVAAALRVALVANGIGAAALLGMSLWTISLSDQALNGSGYGVAEAEAYDTLDPLVSLGIGIVSLVTIPLFIVWLWAAYRCDRVDPKRLTFGTGWAIGMWFVPFLNLVRPYRVTSDLRQGIRSALGDDRPDPYPRSVAWWWAAYLAMNVASSATWTAARRLERVPDDLAWLQTWQAVGWLGAVEAVTTAVAAYLAYVLVARLTSGLRRPEFRDVVRSGAPGT